MGKLYTIGHSTYPIEHLISRIHKYEIQYVLDVRSTPYSQYTPQYNAEILAKELRKNGVNYSQMGKFFGARQPDIAYYPNGYLDFEQFRSSELFRKGRNNVISGLKKCNIALMCTEKRPVDCHRAIMISRGFELIGQEVLHILSDGTLLSQHGLNQQLLDMYFPDRGQMSLFAEDNKTEEEYLIEAYRKQNEKIGYRFGNKLEEGEI